MLRFPILSSEIFKIVPGLSRITGYQTNWMDIVIIIIAVLLGFYNPRKNIVIFSLQWVDRETLPIC